MSWADVNVRPPSIASGALLVFILLYLCQRTLLRGAEGAGRHEARSASSLRGDVRRSLPVEGAP